MSEAEHRPGGRSVKTEAVRGVLEGVPGAPHREQPALDMDLVAAAVIVCAPDGTIVDLNRTAASLLELDRRSAAGRHFLDLRTWRGALVTESGDIMETDCEGLSQRVFGADRDDAQIVGLRREDEATTWLRISPEPLLSPAGDLEALVLTLVDVTGLKATQDALTAAVGELNDLVETLPDTHVHVGTDDRVLRVSGPRTAAAGVPAVLCGEGVGEPVFASFSEESAARLRQAVALARTTGKPVTAEISTFTPAVIRYDEVRHLPRGDGGLLLIIRDITESRRSAEALRESEEKYRTLYLQTPVMLHSIDGEGRLLSVSYRWLQRLGYTADEVLGRPSTDFLTEESRRFAREEALPAFFATGSCEDVPYQMVAADGSVVDVLLSATSERDAEGRIARSLAVLVDVTEQRRALRDLAEQERAMQTLLANIPGMAYRCANDQDWSMKVLSDGCRALTGYEPGDLLGNRKRSYGDLIVPEDRQNVWEAIQDAVDHDRVWTITYSIATRDGDVRHVWERGVGVRGSDGRVEYLEGFVSDITELRRAEEALREREQMLSGLVASLPGAAYRSELLPPWRVSFLSEGFKALSGRDPAVFVKGDAVWTDITHPDDLQRITSELHRDLDARRPDTESEYRIVMPDGAVRWVLDRAVFVAGDDGTPAEMIGLFIDVTSLHEALAAKAEGERRLRTLIGNVPGMVYRSQAVFPWSDEVIAGGDVSVTGYSNEELTTPGFRWSDIMHPDDIPLLAQASAEAAASGRGATEYRIRAKHGEERWLLDRFTLLKDDRGEPLAQEGILLDVTDQHAVLDQLEASRRELGLHADIATLFLTADPNEMFTDVLGVVREAVGARWGFFGYLDRDGTLVAPSLDAEVWDACRVEGKPMSFPRETWTDNVWSRAILTGRSQILSGDPVVPDGHVPIRRAVATPIVYRAETIGVFIVAERDTEFGPEDARLLESIAAAAAPVLHEWRARHEQETARAAAERALRESEQRYRSLYDGSPVGVFVYDTGLVFRDCNPAFEEMFGVPVEKYRGASLASLVRDPHVLKTFEEALRGREAVHEGPYTSSMGRRLWVTMKVAPRHDADGTVVGATAVVVDRTRQKDSEEKVRHLLLHDPVTGLANRTLLEDRIGQAVKHAARKRLAFSVAAFRIDRFDAVGATLGHDDTDDLLEQLGRRLQRAVRAEDTLAYLGGGLLAALLPGAAGPTEAGAAVESILAAVGEPAQVGQHELFLSLSMGVAIYPSDGVGAAELLRNADAAMRRASDEGGGRWRFFHAGMDAERADRLKLDAELHRALEGGQFFLEYQPAVSTEDERIVAVEALIRWRHPERGVLQPSDFVPAAEDSGILTSIGAWVLGEACRQGRTWQRRFGHPLRVGVNISARHLHDETLVGTVRRTLRETGFDPRSLELEITETAAMRDAHHTARILGALRTMGVRVALDDFGTGYSSLSHLVRLPISTVKIDRSFVRDLLSVPEHAAVAASVIALGHRLDLTVVAEGVETVGERDALRDEGCDAIQGFLYSTPLPADEVDALLADGTIRR